MHMQPFFRIFRDKDYPSRSLAGILTISSLLTLSLILWHVPMYGRQAQAGCIAFTACSHPLVASQTKRVGNADALAPGNKRHDGLYTLNTAARSAATSPTATSWYFAEGRVGAGFREYITISNPDPVNKCLVDLQYFLESGGPVTKQVTIAPASRWTEAVAPDLGTSDSGPGISVATIVKNDSTSLCPGIVAERPMYFNFNGNRSGSTVVGATKTGTLFYFADVANGGGYTSFLTILNPPNGQVAQVVVNYYASGLLANTQSIIIQPGRRGTIVPGQVLLPQHSTAVVASTVPISVEKAVYFTNVPAGLAGNVSGAGTVPGATSVQRQWFLAEGYAGVSPSGGKTQENLIIANADLGSNSLAYVTINLDYLDGTRHSFVVTVPPMSQLIWNVNALGSGATSREVSAQIVSTGAGIIVERQMFFNYAHTLNGQTLRATGGTAVTAQPLMSKSYTFAEGYTNIGYNEWLTLQNPTANTETIYLTLLNGLGKSYTQTIQVNHNTRYTVDITALVLAHLALPGNFHSMEISMTVQTLDGSTFVAERPIYFNTAGSTFPVQGGSDVFGYSGI